MEKSMVLDAVSDMLVFATLIKERKPVILYCNTYKLFDELRPNDIELARIVSLAQLTEVKIMVQKHPLIEDDANFWQKVNNFYLLLLSISFPLGFAASIDWCHQITTEKTCIITLKPEK